MTQKTKILCIISNYTHRVLKLYINKAIMYVCITYVSYKSTYNLVIASYIFIRTSIIKGMMPLGFA